MIFSRSNDRRDPNSSLGLVFVFVAPSDPELKAFGLVSAYRCPVEEPVVRH
jgi:hypothetical protein